ncbi:MAG: ligand-binding sensor domain-containing protein [Phocaeicola sp.]
MKSSFLFIFYLLAVCQGIVANSRFYFSGQLTCNLVTDICQDSDGYIWISTEYGLNKFDGNHFSHYLNKADNPYSLIDNSVRRIYLDKQNYLWICCSRGMQYYQPTENAFQTILFEDNPVPHIADIIQLSSGEIWLLDSRKGIFEIDRANNKAYELSQYPEMEVPLNSVTFYQDSKQRIWIGTSDSGLWMYDPQTSIFKNYGADLIHHNWVGSILEDDEGTIFITTSVAVLKWDSENESFSRLQFEGKNLFRPLLKTENSGGIYVITYGTGIYFLDKKSEKIVPLTFQKGYLEGVVDSAKITALFEDSQNNLWLGCFQKGLLCFTDTSNLFRYWNLEEQGLSSKGSLSTLYVDRKECVWGAIEGKGVLAFDANGEVNSQYMKDEVVISLFEDSNGDFWAGTYSKGMASLDLKSGEYSFIPNLLTNRIKSIAEDKNKNLYVAILGRGLKSYRLSDREERVLKFQADANERQLCNQYLNVLLHDSDSLLWIGHYSGIDCYNTELDRVLEIDVDSTLRTSITYSLLQDKKDNIWIGTNKGLFSYNKSERVFKHYTSQDGLCHDVVCGLALDANGNIWCSTFQGISQLNLSTESFISYYLGNGLENKEYSRGIYGQGGGDVIFFGNNEGITHFVSEALKVKEFNQKVTLTRMLLDGKEIVGSVLSEKRTTLGECKINCVTQYFSF